MKGQLNLFLFVFIVALTFGCSFAQKKSTVNYKQLALLLDATSQTTFPGVQGAAVETKFEFSLIWKNNITPQSIFWRNGNTWMTTQVIKITRKNRASDEAPLQKDIDLSEMKLGDSLIIIPIYKSKDVMPNAVRNSKEKVALFFQMNNKAWEYLSIKKITKRPDLLLP